MRLPGSRSIMGGILGACLVGVAVCAARLVETRAGGADPPPVPATPAEDKGGAPPGSADAQALAFRAFVESLRPAALAAGIRAATFDAAFAGLSPDPAVVAATRRQTEFTTSIAAYVANAASRSRIDAGLEAKRRWAGTLARVGERFRVPPETVLSVWGVESNFGTDSGNRYVVQALATLAFVGYRGDFFRDELIQALRILEDGHVSRQAMLGSWAGAMGQTQFMPSSFLKYAVDFDQDGRKDIWGSVPDALASTANFLAAQGWTPGLPWGFEVLAPESYDFAVVRADFGEWRRKGFTAADGRDLPEAGDATLFAPAGAKGPLFLVTDNYRVIKTYNSSDAYALSVALLSERLAGREALRVGWPTDDRPLDAAERLALQTRLRQLGFYAGALDGRLGSETREAVRQFQLRHGIVPADGYAGRPLYEALEAAWRSAGSPTP